MTLEEYMKRFYASKVMVLSPKLEREVQRWRKKHRSR